MSINITPEIDLAYAAYLDEPVDADFSGRPILRRHTFPYYDNAFSGLVDFAAGFQAGSAIAGVALPGPHLSMNPADKLEMDRAFNEVADGVKTGDGAERRVEAAIEKLRRCSLGCGPFGQCKAAMHGVPSECVGNAGVRVDAPTVTDEMALAFHRATADGAIGSDDLEDIKRGLRAVFSAYGVNASDCSRAAGHHFENGECVYCLDADPAYGVKEVPRG
jgi:hypothetical protein